MELVASLKKFVDATVPQAEFLGLTIPDPGMKQNAKGNWEYSAIDWDEFKQVLAGAQLLLAGAIIVLRRHLIIPRHVSEGNRSHG